MTKWTLYDEPAGQIPFTLHGREGVVSIYYGADDNPVNAGFDSLPGVNIPLDLCLGYPVMNAQITDYAGYGYRTYCGWIQTVTRYCLKTAAGGDDDRYEETSIDLPPAMGTLSLPFATLGNLPQMYDAPCRNLGDNYELRWVADTFLCTVPLRSRDEKICRLLGFRWGYMEYAEAADKPVALLPLEITGVDAWNSLLPFLTGRFPDWRFAQA